VPDGLSWLTHNTLELALQNPNSIEFPWNLCCLNKV
jgi:hypothetical protein